MFPIQKVYSGRDFIGEMLAYRYTAEEITSFYKESDPPENIDEFKLVAHTGKFKPCLRVVSKPVSFPSPPIPPEFPDVIHQPEQFASVLDPRMPPENPHEVPPQFAGFGYQDPQTSFYPGQPSGWESYYMYAQQPYQEFPNVTGYGQPDPVFNFPTVLSGFQQPAMQETYSPQEAPVYHPQYELPPNQQYIDDEGSYEEEEEYYSENDSIAPPPVAIPTPTIVIPPPAPAVSLRKKTSSIAEIIEQEKENERRAALQGKPTPILSKRPVEPASLFKLPKGVKFAPKMLPHTYYVAKTPVPDLANVVSMRDGHATSYARRFFG